MRYQSRLGKTMGAAAALALAAAAALTLPAAAQDIKIGYSMAMTGGLGPNGQSALLAQKIWEEDINAKGGLLGRPVKLIYYDDQTNPSTVPGIYAKLLDITPDIVVICSYPPDSVGMVRAVNEIGFKPKMIGGGMVGLQNTSIKAQLGPLLNGFTNYDFWLPVPKMGFPGVAELMKKYQAKAGEAKVDALGYYMAPQAYAQMQVLQQAVEATKSLDDQKLADHIRATTFKTVLGDVKFGKGGEWAESRVLQVQFQNVKGNDIGQFKDVSTQVVITPAEYASGKLVYPFEKAK
jgi:branched-chain amino acid transport system substrate-binding protein